MAKGKKTGGRQPGSLNKRTAALEAAAQAVAERFKAEVPSAFDGDGVSYLQVVYRNPALPEPVRIDAAAKAARYERPALSAVAVQQAPKARIDLSVLTLEERKSLGEMLLKALGATRLQPAIDGVTLRDR